jgi:protein-S-isoprenylcysteine O-methyltransferase Ste14
LRQGLDSPFYNQSAFLSYYFAARGYVLAALLGALIWAQWRNEPNLRCGFLFLIAAGIGLRSWAGAYLGGHGNASKAMAPMLIREGPYRFSRNPLYLSNLLAGSGLVLFAGGLPLWLEGLALIFLLVHHGLLVKWEEINLRAQWGDAYATYARETPRWLGWKSAPVPDGKIPARWDKVWIWQGRNLAYTVLSVLLLWGAARWR